MHAHSAILVPQVHSTVVDHAAGVELREHRHDWGQVSIVLRGTLAVTSAEGWWLVPPGLALWIPAMAVHGARYSESSHMIHLRLSTALTSALPDRCDSLPVTELLRALAFEVQRLQDDASQLDTLNMAARLIVTQLSLPRSGPGLYLPHGRDRRLQQATAVLRAAPGENLSLDALAHRVHTSGRTLARLFVRETGMSFTRWRDYLRIVNAIGRLVRGQSITQAAAELGYASASSFTTLFTRLLGSPPRRYLQTLAGERPGPADRPAHDGAGAEAMGSARHARDAPP